MPIADPKKELKVLYAAKAGVCALIEVPELTILAIDGQGDPNGAEFARAVEALYSIAYTVKFSRKKRGLGPDYAVMPLEGLWGVADGAFSWDAPRETWRWTALIVQPDFFGPQELAQAAAEVAKKKKDVPGLDAALARVRLSRFAEGLCVQTLHVGPYAAERPTVEAMMAFLADRGLSPRGRHHEIYLSDPRRSAPEKLKTILRHPAARI